MKRDEYLCDPDVQDFLRWARSLITGDCQLNHPGPGEGVHFATLRDAYRGYSWAKKSYEDTVELLGSLSRAIRDSAEQLDHEGFRTAALAMLQWGGVSGRNAKRLEALGEEAIPLLEVNARLLDPTMADLKRVWVVQPMNSGFSKIYSLMLDGFPIYDSRVACALASLVRWFCETEGRREVPPPLAFGIPPNQGKVQGYRDPSSARFSFPKTQRSGAGLYARSNVMAAWILDELSQHGPFGELGHERQFALQSAMFMVGHKPLATGN